MLFAVHRYPLTEAASWVGVTLGVALGLLGLRLTRFEITGEGMFYTPSAHLGVALSTLLVGRIVYRFLVSGGAPWSSPGAQHSGRAHALDDAPDRHARRLLHDLCVWPVALGGAQSQRARAGGFFVESCDHRQLRSSQGGTTG